MYTVHFSIQHLVQFGTAAACGQRLGHAEFGEDDAQYPAHWLHPQVVRFRSLRQLRDGLIEAAGVAKSNSRNVMVEVAANSVAWSRRVFSSSIARRICTSADEFNRETSLVILNKKVKFFDKKVQMLEKGSNDGKNRVQ